MAITTTKPQRTIQEVTKATKQLSFSEIYQIVKKHFKAGDNSMVYAVGGQRVFDHDRPLTLYYNHRSKRIVSTFTHGDCYLPVTYFSDLLQPPRIKRAFDDIFFYLTHQPSDDGVYRQALGTLSDVIQDTLTKRFEKAFIDYETFLLTYPTFEETAQRFANTPFTKPESFPFKQAESHSVNVDIADFKPLEVGEFYFKYGQQIMVRGKFKNIRASVMNCLKEYIQHIATNPDGSRYQQVEGIFDTLYGTGQLQSNRQLCSLYTLFIDESLKTVSKKGGKTLSRIKRRILRDIYSP